MSQSMPLRRCGSLPILAADTQQAIGQVPPLSITCDPWHSGYNPNAQAQLAWVPGKGLLVRLSCNEGDPVAQETEPDSCVWLDSCLECFINFRPRESGTGYLNFEVNANGAMLAAYGTGRHNRVFLRSVGLTQPQVTLEKTAGGWAATFLIGIDLIQQFYGMDQLQPGDTVAANFYKCGSRTPVEHYLCWSPIQADHPDFHLPAWFGTLTVTEG